MNADASDPFDIGRFSLDPRHAWALPAPHYVAPEVFAAERRAIFHRSWRFVGHGRELAKPGDYLTQNIAGAEVFVVRGRDDRLRGFHNVCRHRGHRLLDGRRGNVKTVITCPYHAWAYGLDGGLRTARNSENVAGFDAAAFGLSPVRIEEFCGFVFANLDPDARPIGDGAPGFEATLRRYVPDLDRMACLDRQTFDIAANWKVVVENSLDGYHDFLSGPAHRAFSRFMDGHNLRLINRPGWVLLHAGPGTPDNGVYDFRANVGRGQTECYVTFYLWPDLLLFTFPHVNAVWSFLMAPEGPERTREEVVAYTPDGAPLDDATAAAVRWMAEALGPEDVALNLGVQAGLRSPGHVQSRLMIDERRSDMSDHAIHYFQACVLEALGRLPAGSSRSLISPATDVG
ncbi:MAG: aromatic ring-hydroxylating oxygenase subunit alpha [Alphaproteobacteria bacterium]